MSYDGVTAIASSIDSTWMEFNLTGLLETTGNSLTFKSFSSKDSICLSKMERELIISFFQNADNLRLTHNPTQFAQIEENMALKHLKVNSENQVIFISKPLFIRDDSLGIVFYANLCCGQFYGYVNLSFYRIVSRTWTRWIDISSGAF